MTTSQVASPTTRSTAAPDLSSPLSFRTAQASQTSSISVTLFEDSRENLGTTKYRPGQSLPYELRHHCLVYFEEQLYSSAITLLDNLLTAGTSYPSAESPAFVPPSDHVALVGTLLVHPFYTTRASSSDRLEISSESLNLLRNILRVLGPVNARLDEAFIFRRSTNRSRNSMRKSDSNERKSSTSSEEHISSVMTEESSLWKRAQDFWHVVGWALNCSVKYPKRWEYWRIWLEYMIDVLDADWKERSRLDEAEDQRENSSDQDDSSRYLMDSILLRFISDAGGSSGAIKRMIKSLFADGSMESLKIFPEVFDRETRERSDQVGLKRKREDKLDLDEDKYGDWIKNEEDGDEDFDLGSSQPPQSSLDSTDFPDENRLPESDGVMGGPEAIILRWRLLALVCTALTFINSRSHGQLSLASHTLPDYFVQISELYNIFREIISPLPLPAFSLFMSAASRPYLPDAALSSLTQVHLLRLLSKEAPDPSSDELSQENLEKCYLPYAAATSSAEDNAKVSLLTETLFRLFITNCDVACTPELVAAVEKGIAAREKKCKVDRRRKLEHRENEKEMSYLRASATRISLMLQFIQSRQP